MEMAISTTSGFVKSHGVNIHYLARNLDRRKPLSILFVPGVMMPAWIWEKQLAYFSRDYTVVAIDLRSQGESDQTNEGHYAFSIAQDIKAVIDALNLQPLFLVGWSIGVPEVVNYATHFGNELKGLVLVDGLCGIDPTISFYQSTIDYWTQFQMDRTNQTREFMKIIFKQPQTDSYLTKLNEVALRTPTNTVMTYIENYILQDFRNLLPQIHTPTWIATVEGPRLEYMQELKKLLPHSELTIFKEAGHALFVDQPDQFNYQLEAFIHKVQLLG